MSADFIEIQTEILDVLDKAQHQEPESPAYRVSLRRIQNLCKQYEGKFFSAIQQIDPTEKENDIIKQALDAGDTL